MSTRPVAGIEVRTVTAEDWPSVETVFTTPGDPPRCWCQWFRLSGRDFKATPVAARRDALRAECDGDAPGPGVLAWVDDIPAGWAAVAPRAGYPRLLASPLLRPIPDDDPRDTSVWALSCFIVRPEFRSRGVSRALLAGAVEMARSSGARVVEGYPVDVPAGVRLPASQLYHGTRSAFAAAGFVEVARFRGDRPVMRLDLS